MKYLFLIIIYKKAINNSSSFESIVSCQSNIQGSHVILWDNSPDAIPMNDINNIKTKISNVSIEYRHCPENMPISKIYNSIKSEYIAHEYDYIMLLDDDSTFSREIIEKHKEAIEKYGIENLYLPRVRFKGKYVSPARKLGEKGVYIRDLRAGRMVSKRKAAINSGMIINYEYYCMKSSKYDERLGNYGTDDFFIREYSKRNKYFIVIDYTINHDLTCSVLNEDALKLLSRIAESSRAMLILNSSSRMQSLGAKIFLVFRSLYLCAKFKEIGFLLEVLRTLRLGSTSK